MVFAKLAQHEKQAFFDLLDEYFSSRPELLSNLGGGTASGESLAANPHAKAAASAVHNALASNPEATANLISTGLRHGAQSSSAKGSPFASAASNPAIANSVGRVAAASLAFQHRNSDNGGSPPPRGTPPPPPAHRNAPPALPRRTSSTSQEQDYGYDEDRGGSPAPPPGRPPIPKKSTAAPGLVSGRAFGDVDTTSLKSGFLSVKNSTANKLRGPPAVAPPPPPAFQKKHSFAPPPSRRVASDSSPPSAPPPPPARARTPTPEPEPEQEGEWVEALYDYDSGESGDLVIRENQRIKVISRDSEDWWTGELNGKTGLFPASYVRIL